jgi:hypothetical protein
MSIHLQNTYCSAACTNHPDYESLFNPPKNSHRVNYKHVILKIDVYIKLLCGLHI